MCYLVSDCRQSVYQFLQSLVSLSNLSKDEACVWISVTLHIQHAPGTLHSGIILQGKQKHVIKGVCALVVYLKEYSDDSQTVVLHYCLLKQTVLIRVPMDQVELRTHTSHKLHQSQCVCVCWCVCSYWFLP